MKLIVAKHSASKEPQMNIHKNARLTPRSRKFLFTVSSSWASITYWVVRIPLSAGLAPAISNRAAALP